MHNSDIFHKIFNPTFLFAVKYDRTSSGYKHNHDYIELHYVYSGEGRYEIEEDTYDVTAGNLLVLNPGINHANIVTNKENPLTILALGFTDVYLKDQPDNLLTWEGQTPVLDTTPELQEKITSLFFSMLAEKEQTFPGKYDMMRCYLGQIILHVIRAFTQIPEETAQQTNHVKFISHRKNHVIKTIMDYMESHYAEKISLEGIASNMYLSPIYVSKLFKEETGESPIQYLIQVRLKHAVQLMKEYPQYSIKKIAIEVGYEDAFHFSKIFKKHMGVTPKEYRKNLES